MTKQRIDYIDIAKGVGILLVLWAHLYVCDYVHSAIYLFHMPLFFFISGMFYRNPTGCKVYVQKTLRKYVYPYAFFLLAFIPLTLILEVLENGGGKIEFVKMFSATTTNKPLWFLMVLCAMNVIYSALHRLPAMRHAVCLLLFAAAYYCVCYGVHVPPVFCRIGLSLLFYWLGHLYSSQSRVRIESQKKYAIPLVIAYFVVSYFVTGTDIYLLKVNPNPLLFVLAAVVGTFMTLSVSHCLNAFPQNPAVRLLKLLGTNSLYIFAVHWPLLHVLQLCNIPNTTVNLVCEFTLTLFVSLVFAIGSKRLLERFYKVVE